MREYHLYSYSILNRMIFLINDRIVYRDVKSWLYERFLLKIFWANIAL